MGGGDYQKVCFSDNTRHVLLKLIASCEHHESAFTAVAWLCILWSGVFFLTVRYVLLQREEFTREPALLKKLCSAIRKGATVDNCCDLFTAVQRLCGDDVQDPLLEQGRQQQEEVS